MTYHLIDFNTLTTYTLTIQTQQPTTPTNYNHITLTHHNTTIPTTNITINHNINQTHTITITTKEHLILHLSITHITQ